MNPPDIESIRQRIADATQAIQAAQKAVDDYEIETSTDDYDDMLNDTYGYIDVCGLKYAAAQVLKEVDPTAYRCGKSDWEDSLDKADFEDYQELETTLEEAESALADAEAELEDAENVEGGKS